LRQLVDPACKALSPAVNDPYTAIQAVERLSVLFAALAARPLGPLGPIVAHDPTAGVTVVVLARSFTEHLALGVGLIRRYGAPEPTVIQALLRLLATVLAACTEPDRWSAIEAQADLLVAAAERGVADHARPGRRLRRGRRPAPGPGRPSSRRPARPGHHQWPTPLDTAAPDMARPASPVSGRLDLARTPTSLPRAHSCHVSVCGGGRPGLLAGLVLAVQHLPQDA
jgi:hypothetical protein